MSKCTLQPSPQMGRASFSPRRCDWSRVTLFLVASLLLFGCSNNSGTIRLKGNFQHLEQGAFLIYSTDGGLDIIDSLHIQGGKFDWTTPLEDEATYHILYPNFSELVIFGKPGTVLTIKGDAQNLNAVKVKGDEENEIYTRFRADIDGMKPQEAREVARQYIFEYPTLAVSRYLLFRYFLQSEKATPEEVQEVYDSLSRANPEDVRLSRLESSVRSRGKLDSGQPMVPFELVTRVNAKDSTILGDTVRLEDYEGKYLLLAFWASWKSGSQSALYRARRVMRESKNKVRAISYSLDVEEKPLHNVELQDSVDYPSYCDYLCWRSPLVRQLGIADLPYFVLVDSTQQVVASGTNWQRDIEPKTKDLCL